MLENLNIGKKTVIAKVHFVITILKLKSNNKFNSRFYRVIWVYIILLS